MSRDILSEQDMLQLVEVIRTMIGESRYAGYPCTLIRLGGCNLECKYCDTKHAQKDHVFEEHIFDTGQKIKDKWVLITGGEPLLQEPVYELMNLLLRRDKKVVLETNGSIDISKVPENVYKIVDIKTPSSEMNRKMDYRNVKHLRPTDEVKFVIADDDDFDFAMKIIDEYSLLELCDISFSPVFGQIDPEELLTAIMNSRLPIRLNLQLHKMLGIK